MTNPFGDLNIESILLGGTSFGFLKYLKPENLENGNEPMHGKARAFLTESVQGNEMHSLEDQFYNLKSMLSADIHDSVLGYAVAKMNTEYDFSGNSIKQFDKLKSLVDNYRMIESHLKLEYGLNDVDGNFKLMLGLVAESMESEPIGTTGKITPEKVMERVQKNRAVIESYSGYYDVGDRIDFLSTYLALELGDFDAYELHAVVTDMQEFVDKAEPEFAGKPASEKCAPLIGGIYLAAGLDDLTVEDALKTLEGFNGNFSYLNTVQKAYVAGRRNTKDLDFMSEIGLMNHYIFQARSPVLNKPTVGSGTAEDMVAELRRLY